MSLKFFNSLTRKKEEFTPMKQGQVGLYTCGPTVYDFAHIGNFKTYAFEDVLRRYLKFRGFKVKQVMNITDVDDKIIKAVKRLTEEGNPVSATDFTQKYIDAFFEDLDALNIERAEVYPKATEYVGEMVKIIKILMAKGIGYKGEDGSIYYSIAKFPQYGKLAHINVEELKVGARVKHDEYEKESLSDFALWKAWDPDDGDVFWETELGKGRPGWHIECSAMSSKNLGKHFDIHTGGIDNLFPHHENEIAQSEGAYGGKFVNYWLHSDHLLVDGTKMAKSKNNFYTLRDLKEKLGAGFDPLALRYLYVTSDYRKKLDFTFKGLEAATKALDRIRDFLKRMKKAEGEAAGGVDEMIVKAKDAFIESMDDDLNASRAIGEIFTFISDVNKLADEGKINGEESGKIIDFILEIDTVFGLKLEKAIAEDPLEMLHRLLSGKGIDLGLFGELVDKKISERNQARKEKDFARADRIRDEIQEMFKEFGMHFHLKDTAQGTTVWKITA